MKGLLKMPVAYCVVGIGLAFLLESVRSDWWGLVVLSALISLYAFLAKGDKDGGRFQTGDNCYFIGFVYTLSIITLSLILDAEALLGGAGERSLQPLLKTIGIALGTSVVGMLWRFGLTYDIRVGEDAFDQAVRDAATAANSLKGVVKELQQTINDASSAISEQSRKSATGLSRLSDEVRERLDAAAATTTDALQTVVEKAVDSIALQGASLTQSTMSMVEILRSNTEAHADAVLESLDRISSSLESYVSAVDDSARHVGETLEKAAQQALTRVANGVTEALQATTFSDIQQALDAVVQAHQEAVVSVNHTLTNAVDGLRDATTRAVAYADEARNALAAIEGATPRQDLDAVTLSIDRFREEVKSLTEQITQLVAGQAAATAEAQRYGQQLASLHDAFINLQFPQNAGLNRPDAPMPPEPPSAPSGSERGGIGSWFRRR